MFYQYFVNIIEILSDMLEDFALTATTNEKICENYENFIEL